MHEKHRFDLILMDVQMPVMDGFEATAAIRGKEDSGGRIRVSIIALSANALKGGRERLLEAGMDGWISKPFRPRELFEAVETCGAPAPSDVPESELRATGDDAARGHSQVSPVRNPTSPDAGARVSAPTEYDRIEALRQCGGSEEILQDMVALFLKERPTMMDDIQRAKDDGDPKRLELASHTLKGAVLIVAAHQAVEAAYRLECMGKEGDLSHVEEAWKKLEEEVRRLQMALEP